jgi:serine/threonine-protein kinase RsbW
MVQRLSAAVEPTLSGATRFKFELCISEALNNLVTHARPKVSAADINIDLTVQPEAVLIEIFDPAGAEPFYLREMATDLSRVDEMSEGGRGLGLIMEFANEVEYGPSGNGYSLSLKFWDIEPDHTIMPPAEGACE